MQTQEQDPISVIEIQQTVDKLIQQHDVHKRIEALSNAVEEALSEKTDERHLPSFSLPEEHEKSATILKAMAEQFRTFSKELTSLPPAPELVQKLDETLTAISACLSSVDYLQYCAHASRDLALSNEAVEDAQRLVEKTSEQYQQSGRKLDPTTLPDNLKQALALLKTFREAANGYTGKLLQNINHAGVAHLSSFATTRIKFCDDALAVYDAIPKFAVLPMCAGAILLGLLSLVVGIPYKALHGILGLLAVAAGHIALSNKPDARGRGLAIGGLLSGYLSIALLVFRFLAVPQTTGTQYDDAEIDSIDIPTEIAPMTDHSDIPRQTRELDLSWLHTIDQELDESAQIDSAESDTQEEAENDPPSLPDPETTPEFDFMHFEPETAPVSPMEATDTVIAPTRREAALLAARLLNDPENVNLVSALPALITKTDDMESKVRLAVVYSLGCILTGDLEEAAIWQASLNRNVPDHPALHSLSPLRLGASCTQCQGSGGIAAPCGRCAGSRQCLTCHGSGTITLESFSGTKSSTCSICSGHGRCRECLGTGQRQTTCHTCRGQGDILCRQKTRQEYRQLLEALVDGL